MPRRERQTIRDGVHDETTRRFEDRFIMIGSTLDYVRNNLSTKEKEFSFEMLMKLAEWHVK